MRAAPLGEDGARAALAAAATASAAFTAIDGHREEGKEMRNPYDNVKFWHSQ